MQTMIILRPPATDTEAKLRLISPTRGGERADCYPKGPPVIGDYSIIGFFIGSGLNH